MKASRLALRVSVQDDLSPRMRRARVACLRARVACLRAQARLDALSGDPADKAWAEVMDALFALVSEVPAPRAP